MILYIKKLLREEKYTIEGAKKLIRNYSIKEEDDEAKKEEVSAPKISKLSPVTGNEMSLFENEASVKYDDNLKNENLKDDLLELRSFLKNLLDGMK